MIDSILFGLIALLIVLILAAVIIPVLSWRKRFAPFPIREPHIGFNEKYRFRIRFSETVLRSRNPLTPITRSLVSFGFLVADAAPGSIVFEKPFRWNEFLFALTVQRMQVRLRMDLPIQPETPAYIDVVGGCIGTGGPLWKFAQLLREHIEGGGARCTNCCYNLRGIGSDRCPECGGAIRQ